MRLQGKKKTNSGKSFLFIALLTFIALLILFFENQQKETATVLVPISEITCSAETVEGDLFVDNQNAFSGGEVQSKDRAFTGKRSMRLSGKHQYGFGYTFKNLKPGDQLKASVWVYRTGGDRGHLAFKSKNTEELYLQENIPAISREDNWQKIILNINIPRGIKATEFQSYVYVNENSGPVYFDDLRIQILENKSLESDSYKEFYPGKMSINTDKQGYEKLNAKKWEAVAKGNLFTKDDDWVPAEIRSPEGERYESSIRLKGDWLDHLRGNKWSFRVKLKGDLTWRGMKTFSVQSCHTRSFLMEWFYHQWMIEEDILCPRYDFIELALNEEDRGIYAYEEHFTKLLVERRSRREGPIIKFTEDAMWKGARRGRDVMGWNMINDQAPAVYKASRVVPFSLNKTMESPNLKKQFDEARSMLTAFKNKKTTANDVFDLERMAKWYAIVDIMQAYHSLTWHNLRFYYNPVVSKLEPIGFDGFGENHQFSSERPFLAYHYDGNHLPQEIEKYLLDDPEFMKLYGKYLSKFSDEAYLKEILLNFEEDWKLRNEFINKEYPNYNFESKEILNNARRIRTFLLPYEAEMIQAFWSDKQLVLLNGHGLPVEIKSIQSVEGEELLDENIFVFSSGEDSAPKIKKVGISRPPRNIEYAIAGIDSLFSINVWQGRPPIKPSDNATLKKGNIQDVLNYATLSDGEILFKDSMTWSENVIVPSGYNVIFKAGTKIDLINNASFISYSPVQIKGMKGNRVMIQSSDKSAGGFSVLQPDGSCLWTHVKFSGFNTLNKGNWILTGAVTLYEAECQLIGLEIENNVCEDALNLIRSKFEIDSLTLNNTAFDGFDGDFCQGIVKNSTFARIGNDALDFSGSVISIENCVINGAGDKGISVGEQSNVTVTHCEIKNSNIGLASKDLSQAVMQSSKILNCNTGFAAYQKKPEFGPASIEVIDLLELDAKFSHQIEEGSVLRIDDKELK